MVNLIRFYQHQIGRLLGSLMFYQLKISADDSLNFSQLQIRGGGIYIV